MDGGGDRGRGHHAMLRASMPSCPPIRIHPHLPAHRPPPMGWLCLPVCLQTNQSDHRMRTQKKKEEDRLTAGVPGKFLLHSYSSDLRCSGVIIIIIIYALFTLSFVLMLFRSSSSFPQTFSILLYF